MLERDGGRDLRDVDERYASAAARLLRHELGDESPFPHDRRRDAVVAAMALAIAGRARRRRIAIVSAVTFAAAAGVALVFGLSGRSSTALVVDGVTGRGNVLVHMASTQSLVDRQNLVAGDSIRSGDDGTASLTFANGTNLALSPASSLRVDEVGSTRRFFLSVGGVKARVSKLSRGERFVVDTPDSEVEVRGTVFTVGVKPPSESCVGPSSTIDVSEGTVWVRSGDTQVILRAGESWSTPCVRPEIPDELPAGTAERAPAAAPGPSAARVRSAARKSTVTRSMAVPQPHPVTLTLTPPAEGAVPEPEPAPLPAAPVSRLAEQNDLFSAAMAAERRGQHTTALRKLDELISRFPAGPLTESARGERTRILSASH